MRHILTLLLLVGSFCSFGQGNTTYQSALNTTVFYNGGLGAAKRWVLPMYSDTTAANSYYSTYPNFTKKGNAFFDTTNNLFWLHDGSKWVTVQSSGITGDYIINQNDSFQNANFAINGQGQTKRFVVSTSDSVYVRDTTGAIAIGYTDDTSASVVKATGVSAYANGVATTGGKIIASGRASTATGHVIDGGGIQATNDADYACCWAGRNSFGHIGKVTASGYYSFARGVAYGGDVMASGGSSFVNAYIANNANSNVAEATASGTGSFVNAALSNGGSAKASSTGSAIFGTAQRIGYLLASGAGSFVTGIIPSSGSDSQNIRATNYGSVAHGIAQNGGNIFSDGAGSMAGGYSLLGGLIQAGVSGSDRNGNFAWGYARSGNLGAVGESAFAFGFANVDSLWSADSLSVTFGENVKNYGKHSFAFGKGYSNSRNNQAVFGWNNYKDFRVDGLNHVLLTNNDADTLATLANTRGLSNYIHNGTTQQTANFNINGTGRAAKMIINSSTDNGSALQVNGTSTFANVLTTNFGTTNRTVRITDSSMDLSRTSDGAYTERIVGRSGSFAFVSRSGFTFVSNGANALSVRESGAFNNGLGFIESYPIIAASSMASGNNTSALLLRPTLNLTGTFSGTVRGVYYNPIITSLVGTRHVAFEVATGDNYFNTTSGNFGIGYSSNTTLSNKFNVNGNALVNDTLLVSVIKQRGSGILIDSSNIQSIDWKTRALKDETGVTVARYNDGGFQGQLKIKLVTNVDHAWSASESIVLYESLSSSRVVSLTPASVRSGVIYTLKDKDGSAGANTITLSLTAGTIDGASDYTINSPYGYVQFFCDGTNCYITSK